MFTHGINDILGSHHRELQPRSIVEFMQILTQQPREP
jgi:hypothetical protein